MNRVIFTRSKMTYICSVCEAQFVDYRCKQRKFCSNACNVLSIDFDALGKKLSVAVKKAWDEGRKKGAPMSIRGRKNISNAHKKRVAAGLHHLGDGSKTKESVKVRTSMEYRIWRTEVYKRDDYTCQVCHIKSGSGQTVYLNAHHIKPFSKFPELRFDITNGVTLCKQCHFKTPSYGRPKK
jgi:predicted restriction endonuclease